MEESPCFMGKPTMWENHYKWPTMVQDPRLCSWEKTLHISMVMFNRCVKLPEGICWDASWNTFIADMVRKIASRSRDVLPDMDMVCNPENLINIPYLVSRVHLLCRYTVQYISIDIHVYRLYIYIYRLYIYRLYIYIDYIYIYR